MIKKMDLKHAKLILILLLAFAVIFDLLGAIVFAVVIAYLTKPLFEYLHRFIRHRATTALMVCFLVLLAIIFPIAFAVSSLLTNSGQIVNFVSDIAVKFTELAKGAGSGSIRGFTELFMQKVLSALSGALMNVPKRIIDLFIMLTLVYYFLKDGPKIRNYIYSLAKETREKNIIVELEKLLHGVIVGNIFAAIIMGLIAYAIFLAFGVEFAAILAVIIGLSALIPIIGPWLVYIPLILYYLLTKSYQLALAFILVAVLMQFLEIYLAPRLSEHIVKIHRAILIIGYIGGPLMFGAKGIIIGPLILGAAKIILDAYRK